MTVTLGHLPPRLHTNRLDNLGFSEKICLIGPKPFIPLYYSVTRQVFLGNEFNCFSAVIIDKRKTYFYDKIKNSAQKISEALRSNTVSIWTFSKTNYFIFTGAIFTERSEPLLLFVFNQEGKEIIFLNTLLVLEPSYASLYKKLMRDIVSPHIRKGIEVYLLSTSQINENTLEEIKPIKNFASFIDQENYMNNELPKVMNEDYEDTFLPLFGTLGQVPKVFEKPAEKIETVEILVETSAFTLTD